MDTSKPTEESAKAKGWPCHMCRFADAIMSWKCRKCIKTTAKSKPSRWLLKVD